MQGRGRGFNNSCRWSKSSRSYRLFSQIDLFHALPALYTVQWWFFGIHIYTDHSIVYYIFHQSNLIFCIQLFNVINCDFSFPKQCLWRNKAFLSSTIDSVHCTVWALHQSSSFKSCPERLCEAISQLQRKSIALCFVPE